MDKQEIIKAVMDVEYQPVPIDESSELTKKQIAKLPLGQVAGLGAAFSSIVPTIQQTGGGETLYRMVIPQGATGSVVFKNGETIGNMVGSNGGTITGRARFQEVAGSGEAGSAVNATMIFIAAAIICIEKQLTEIQDTQEEMMDFLKLKEDAKLKGDLNTLTDVINNYKYNWDNETYKVNKHILVQDIKRDAESSIIFFNEMISKKLATKEFIKSEQKVKNNIEKIKEELKDYQLALYLYGFASFLEVMLLENFDKQYMDGIYTKLQDYSIDYRTIYTNAYNRLEDDSKGTIEFYALKGLGKLSTGAGKAVEKIPVLSKSQLNENLKNSGERLTDYNENRVKEPVKVLQTRKDTVIKPFMDGLDNINRIYNTPLQIMADMDNLYLVGTTE